MTAPLLSRVRERIERAWRARFGGYAARMEQESQRFAADVDVHALPDIFHYWSNRWLLPMEQAFGFDHPHAFLAGALAKVARASPRPARFVSLGCGNCDTEVDVVARMRAMGVEDFTIDCLDVNAAMLARGTALASANGVDAFIAVVQGDFNRWSPAHAYDAVVAHQSLHHVVELERLFDTIGRLMPPHGAFVTSDVIGRNGHQRWPEALAIVRELWQELPRPYRYNIPLQRMEEQFMDWDCSKEGFEGIRAQDILPLCVDRFGFESFLAFANVIDPFIDRSFGHHFDANAAWDRDFIDRVHARDEAEIRAGRIKPTHMMAVMTNDRGATPRIRDGLTPAGCVRVP